MSMFHELMMRKKGMPSRYQEVEYIESTGTQYIDTGIIPANIPNLKIEFCISNFSSGRFGTQRNNYYGITNWALCPFITNNNSYIQLGGSGTEVSVSSTPLQKHNYFVDIENQKIIIDNQTEISTSFSTTNAIDNFFLFADNFNQTANNFASAKVYCFRFYSGSTLIRNFIPVYDTLTNKYGMWESVQGKFYGNAGTGDFKGSIVGYTVVGSLTESPEGVFSGFSGTDYIKTNQNFPNDLTNNYEIQVKFTTPSSLSDAGFVVGMVFRGTQSGIRVERNFSLTCYIGGSNEVKSSANYLLPSTDYIVRVIIKNNVLSLFCGTNESNMSLIDAKEISEIVLSTPTYMAFGMTSYSNIVAPLTGGSIDLNKTLVKVNNKLWFNGQQA